MKFAALLLMLLLSGCITTQYEKDGVKISYTDWFKRASDVNIKWGGVEIQIGDISSEITAEDIATYMKVMSVLATPTK